MMTSSSSSNGNGQTIVSISSNGEGKSIICRSGPGNDILSGGSGDDIIYGGKGNDRHFGNGGDGGTGNLVGGVGRDYFDCGPGQDTISRFQSV